MNVLAHAVHWFQAHSILVMLGIFAGMTAFVYAPSRRASMERCAHIPLEEEV